MLTGCVAAADPLEKARRAAESGREIDFSELNGAIAWLYIPGSSVNAPISVDGEGFFLQSAYNDTDFCDPVTVIYYPGYSSLEDLFTRNGALDRFREIRIFTQDAWITWRVIGVSAYSDRHILETYQGFHNADNISLFLEDVRQHRTMVRYIDPNEEVKGQLLVLSTHMRERENERFLVLAIPVDR